MQGLTKPRVGLLLFWLAIGAVANAQTFVTPGANTNVVGVTPNPEHIPDYGMKQQQEPSCIVRPSNRSFMFCAYNDMRASDLPDVQGDGWIGVSQSADGGETWFSRLSPGFLGDTANSLGMGFAADPSVVAIPGNSPGLAVLNFIGAFRDSNDGVLAIQRWVEMPREDADFWKPETIIRSVADGTSGRFIDKPAFLYVPDPVSKQTTLTQQISVEDETTPITVTTPTGTLFVAYAVFTGSQSVKVLLQFSRDNGISWSRKIKLSEDQNEVTGVSLTSIDGDVVAVWRRKADNNNGDAIMTAFCSQGGTKCAKAKVMFDLCPFDQPATDASPRTFAFPSAASSGNQVWAFAAGRRFAGDASCTPVPAPAPPGTFSGIPRIVGMSSADGKTWVGSGSDPSVPFVVDTQALGYQFMPSAFGSRGHVDIAWYDTRREEPLPPGNTLPDGITPLPLVNDYLAEGGLARVFRKADVYMTRLTAGADCATGGPQSGCTPVIEDSVRVSQFPFQMTSSNVVLTDPFANLEQAGQEVKAHNTGLRLYASGTLAFGGDYIAVATPSARRIQGTGGAPGPWIPNFEPEGARGAELPGFVEREDTLVAWGDNRDVIDNNFIFDPAGDTQLPYTPTTNSTAGIRLLEKPLTDPEAGDGRMLLAEETSGQTVPDDTSDDSLKAASEPDDDPTRPADTSFGVCGPGNDFSLARDSNVYASLVADEPSLTASITTKPLSTIQRMYPVQMHNPEAVAQSFCLVIEDQPSDAPLAGRASFFQLPASGPFAFSDGSANPAGLQTALDVLVPANSSASRAVFVVTADSNSLIPVSAYDGVCGTPGATLQSSVLLGNGELLDPEFCAAPIPSDRLEACQLIASNETHNIQLLSPNLQAPLLQAPNFQAPNFQAPILQAPNFQAPNFQAPNLQAPILQAPNFQADTLLAPNLQAPNFQAPNFQAPNLQAAALDGDDTTVVSYQDVTFVVSALANTTTTYSADIGMTGLNTDDAVVQLIAWTPNVYATSRDCQTQPTADNQVIAAVDLGADDLQSVNLPSAFSPDDQDPYAGEVSFTGTPGQNIAVTARIWATGATAGFLQTLHDEYLACLAGAPPGEEIATCAGKGVGSLITFGASAHGCSTNRLDPTFSTDCLNNGAEKILVDRLPPVLNLPADFSVEAVAATTAVNYTATAVDGNDGPVAINCVPASGTSLGLGANTVSCDASDAAGNLAIGSFTVTLVDTTAPMVDAMADITGVEASGPGGAAVTFSTPAATDAVDGLLATGCSPASGSTFDIAGSPHTVTCSVTDNAGNNASTTFVVSVVDTTAPAFVPIPVDLGPFDATDASGTIVNYALPAVFEAVDTAPSVSCTPAPGSTFVIGTTTVACTATDSSSNSAAAMFNVTVADQSAPSVSAPATVTVEPRVGDPTDVAVSYDIDSLTGSFTVEANLPLPEDGAIITFSAPATDSVDSNPAVTCTPASGSLFNIAGSPHAVSCTATDAAGNTSLPVSFSIVVQDTTDPVFSVADGTTYSFSADQPGGAFVDLVGDPAIDLHATDRGEKLLPVCSATPQSGGTAIDLPAILAPGDYDVTCSIDGVTTTMVTIMVNVDVDDVVPPVLTIPAPLLEVDADPLTGTAIVDFLANGAFPNGESIQASDIVDTDVAISCTPPSGSEFSAGSHAISCTASDDGPNASGTANTTTASFTLVINDITAPLVVLAGNNPQVIEGGSAYIEAGILSAVDAVDGDVSASLMIDATAINTLAVSSYTVFYTVNDAAGNERTVQRIVNVVDNTPPAIGPLADITAEATSPAGAAVTWDPVFATDIIDNQLPATCTPASGSTFDIPGSPHQVVCSATDANGNTGSALFNVTVQDTTAPAITAADVDIVQLGATVNLQVDYITGNVTVTDDVDPNPVLTCNPTNPVTFTDYGTSTISCTATDASGNISTPATTFDINVFFPYGINLVVPKKNARAGSTIPIDWQYLDPATGSVVDSSSVVPVVNWVGPFAGNDSDCSGGTPGTGNGEDSGSSSIRYSASSMNWQLSWQTPTIAGRYLLMITPPSATVPEANACVRLR